MSSSHCILDRPEPLWQAKLILSTSYNSISCITRKSDWPRHTLWGVAWCLFQAAWTVLGTYLGNSHGPDFLDVNHAIVPGHQALHVDVELVPQSPDGFVVLLNPRKHKGKTRWAWGSNCVPHGKPGCAHWTARKTTETGECIILKTFNVAMHLA